MYFLPRNNKLYSFLVHLNVSYRYALTLLICLTGIAIWFFAIHTPISSSFDKISRETKQLQNQQILFDQASKSYASLASSVEKLKNEFKKYAPHKTNEQYVHDALLFLIDQAAQCNITMNSCTIDNEQDRKWYIENSVSIAVTGEFEKIIKYLEAVSVSSHLIALKQFNINHASDKVFSFKGALQILTING